MKATRITCSIRRDHTWRSKIHVESLNKCIGELQRQTGRAKTAQRLALQDAQYGFVESRREQVRLQEELSMKEKVLRDTQIRKYARNGRNEESASTTKLMRFSSAKNEEKTMRLFNCSLYQLQQLEEQMNSTKQFWRIP